MTSEGGRFDPPPFFLLLLSLMFLNPLDSALDSGGGRFDS